MGKVAKRSVAVKLNTEEVSKDQRFYESVFNKIPGMIYVHDLVKDINVYRSWTLKKVLGYKESATLKTGKGIRALVHANDIPVLKHAAEELQVAEDNQAVRFSYRMKHKDGSWLWFQSEEYVYERNAAGKPIKCLGYATDLTETIEQKTELDKLNRVNQLILKSAEILSNPNQNYREALKKLAKEVSDYLNVVCDISILEVETGLIQPVAYYHNELEVRNILAELFREQTVAKGQGLVGKVIDSGKELFIEEVPDSVQKGPRKINPKIVPQSILYVPLVGSQSILGSLNVTRLEGQEPIDNEQANQIRRLSEYVAIFLENGMLKEHRLAEVERRIRVERQLEEEKLWAEFKVEVSTLLTEIDEEFEKTIKDLTKRLSVYFNAICDFQLVKEDSDEIIPVAIYAKNKKVRKTISDLFKKSKMKIGEGMIGNVIETGVELFVPEVPQEYKDMAETGIIDKSILPSSFFYFPLPGHNGVMGTLNITRLHDQTPLSQSDIYHIKEVGALVARFIDNRLLFLSQSREIEHRKKIEHKLARTAEFLEKNEIETRNMLNTIPIYIAQVSKNLKYTFLNDKYWDIGMNPKSYEGKSIQEVLGAKAMEFLRPRFESALSGETISYDYDGEMADGVHRYFNVALAPDYGENGAIKGFYSCASDITSKVLAQQEAQLTQDRLETLSLNSGDAFFFHDSDQNILDVNQVATDLLGYSRVELLNLKAGDIDPRWEGRSFGKFLSNLEPNIPQTFDTIVHKKNGEKVPVEVRFVKRLENEKIYIQSLLRDRTEKKRQEEKLQRSEERLRLIFENVDDFIATISEEGTVESVNKTTQGVQPDSVIGKSVFDWYPDPVVRETVKQGFKHLIETGEGFEIDTTSFEGPDGSVRLYHNNYIGKFGSNASAKVILIIRDVTGERNRERSVMNAVLKGQEQERKRLGAELHDGIGQILTAIALQVSQLNDTSKEIERKVISDELQELQSKLRSAIKEVRNISHDLMPEVLESFGLLEAVKQTCNSLHDKSGIDVKFDHVDVQGRYHPTLEMNLYRITQELLNNIQKHASCHRVFVSLMDYEETLNLTVEDDGSGFEVDEERNGIGLRNVVSRVELLNGMIDLESAIGGGTLVNIEIPKQQA